MQVQQAISEIMSLKGEKVSYEALGKALGFSKQYVGQIKSKELTDIQIQKIEKFFDVDFTKVNDNNTDDCVIVDHIHINPSCGKGTVVLDDADITPIKLGTAMLQSVMKISHPQNLKTFRASGDSMETIIEDGDMLLVDTGRTDFSNGGIFLLTINNDWFVKRLRKRLSGELDIISDNEKYPVETFKPDDNIEIVVKGRVVKNLSRGL